MSSPTTPDSLEPTPLEYLDKADRYLSWAEQALASMRDAGKRGDLGSAERDFARILSEINVAFEALADASRTIDSGKVAGEMNHDRRKDPLLNYFWKSRVAETHQLLRRELSFAHVQAKVT